MGPAITCPHCKGRGFEPSAGSLFARLFAWVYPRRFCAKCSGDGRIAADPPQETPITEQMISRLLESLHGESGFRSRTTTVAIKPFLEKEKQSKEQRPPGATLH